VLDQLDRHPQLSLVVVSDSDVVWLRQPWNWLSQRPNADFFVSTDCLSVKVRRQVGLWGGWRLLCMPGSCDVCMQVGIGCSGCEAGCSACWMHAVTAARARCKAASPVFGRWRRSGCRRTTSRAAAT
jgi:hypothetical protein